MTDLERLWEELPTPPAPTAAILREARRGQRVRRRRTWLRPALVAATAAAVGGAFVLGATTGGPSGSTTGSAAGSAQQPSPVAFIAPLKAATSCQALLSSYVDRGLAGVTAYGWRSPAVELGTATGPQHSTPFGGPGVLREPPGRQYLDQGRVENLAGANALAGSNGTLDDSPMQTTRVTASGTGTNVQEGGVDEPDTVKTDGRLLVQVHDDELRVYDVSGAHPRRRSVTDLHAITAPELLLAGDTVVVLGTDPTSPRSLLTGRPSGSRVETISLADPRAPKVVADVAYSSAITAARQTGTTIRLVLSSGLPNLPFLTPGRGMPAARAEAHNRRVVQHSVLSDWLPTYDAGHGTRPLLSCSRVAIPPDQLGLDTVSVVGFDVAHPTAVQAVGLAGATSISYESQSALFLAATPSTAGSCPACLGYGPRASTVTGGTTYLFQFAVHGDRIDQVASGAVDGIVADRWSMDQTGRVLRLALGPSSTTGPFNQVVTMRRRGHSLQVVGRTRVASGDQIESVRWFPREAIVSTSGAHNPLYVVDLRRPHRPSVAGRLDLAGYSGYLHPLGPYRLVGVGSGPGPAGNWGAELGLFKVHDLPHVQLLDQWHYGPGTRALAASDPLQFTWLPEDRAVLTVVEDGDHGWLSVQKLYQGRFHNRMIPVGYGPDVAEVRTIGLAPAKVALVTANAVRFLHVPMPPACLWKRTVEPCAGTSAR